MRTKITVLGSLRKLYLKKKLPLITFASIWTLLSSFPCMCISTEKRVCIQNSYIWVPALGSVQFSGSVISDFLQPHELQHARPPCPSPNPGLYPNSCASSQWCHPAISSSVIPLSSCPQSLPASGSFPVNQLFAWGGQSTGVSASALEAPVLPVNTQDWSPLGWTGWLS